MATNVIKKGDSGVVYLSDDGRAIKKVLKHNFVDLLILNHLNILEIYKVEVVNDFRYITMEACNKTLFDALKDGELEYNDTITEQIFEGIRFIHQKKFVHRNIKPNNVLINSLGIVKLADGKGNRRVSKGDLYYTCQFNSPEILKFYYGTEYDSDVIDCTEESDIFALGCLIHIYMYNFRHPFGKDALEIECNILEGNPKEMSHDFPYYHMISNIPELRKI